jgi:hypothetical protein
VDAEGAAAGDERIFPRRDSLRCQPQVLPHLRAYGEAASSVNSIEMNRNATDETVMLRLPACEACFHDNTGDWLKRKLKMGCLMVVAIGVAAFGGARFKEDGLKLLSVVVGVIIMVLGTAGRKGGRKDAGVNTNPARVYCLRLRAFNSPEVYAVFASRDSDRAARLAKRSLLRFSRNLEGAAFEAMALLFLQICPLPRASLRHSTEGATTIAVRNRA